jgi:hypothetical protein
VSKGQHNIDVNDLVDAIQRRSNASDNSIASPKNMNVLVLGVIGAVGALVWNTTLKTPESFSLLQQQTAEIRTTVLEMKTTLGDINSRLDNNTRATADQQAKLTGLEQAVKSNSERLDRLESSLQDNRGYRTR